MKSLGILKLIIISLLGLGIVGVAEAIAPGWSEPINIAPHPYFDTNPSLFQDQNGVYWVVWRSTRAGDPYADICISNSSDGFSWSLPTMVVTCDASTGGCDMPSLIQASDGIYWLAYTTYPNSTYKSDIWIKNSSDGINWNASIPVAIATYQDIWPSLIQNSTGSFWIVFESDDRDGTDGDPLYITTSSDGVTWSAPQNITKIM
jgi:hypothetical protein